MKPEEQFHFKDGSRIASLDELRDKIERISYDEFYHHVTSSRNDFANWIRYVLKDPQLADQLEKVDSIVETVELLNDYLQPRKKKKEPTSSEMSSDIQSRIENLLHVQIPEERKSFEPQEEPEESPEQISVQEEVTHQIEEPQQEFETKQEPEEAPHESHHYSRTKEEKEELDNFHHQLDRIIVKDFIWGMIFGLIVGFILARVLVL